MHLWPASVFWEEILFLFCSLSDISGSFVPPASVDHSSWIRGRHTITTGSCVSALPSCTTASWSLLAVSSGNSITHIHGSGSHWITAVTFSTSVIWSSVPGQVMLMTNCFPLSQSYWLDLIPFLVGLEQLMTILLPSGYLDQGLMVRDTNRLLVHYFGTLNMKLDFLSIIPTDILYFVTGISCTDGSMPCPVILRVNRLFKVYRLSEFFDR